MWDKILFYVRHSINDLRVNGQRTLFALLCIAAGVAAIVSLQTLAVMIGDTLTGNLQENNRGDIQFQPGAAILDSEDAMQQGVEDGVLAEDTMRFFGQEQTTYLISEEGLATLQAWLDENFPGQAELTYRQPMTNMLNLFLGSGTGTAVSVPETGAQVASVSPIVIDAAVYPFYGQILAQDGTPLADLIREPTDVVLSERVAADLEAGVGDVVRLSGAREDFTVRGVVATEVEVKDPASADLFAGMFGFYYLDHRAVALFSDAPVRADMVYLHLADPAHVTEINEALAARFPYLRSRTTEDLRADYTELANNIDQLVTIMGLVSLLIGSIGIINTMQVIVRRRTLEVAVLKTLGLQANQVTVLFLVEAVLMGVVGSLAGIVLGWAATFVIKGAAESFLGQALPFRVAAGPAFNGLIVGTLVTTVFGFLPTLTAGQVRPAMVLRPADNVVPRAGRLRSLLALLVVIVALSLVAQTILGDLGTAFAVVVGAFLAAGLLYLGLSLVVWLVGYFLPTFGSVDLKITLRQMLAGRGRAAVTLLALVVGVFSLSLITLFAQSITSLLEFALDESAGGNVAITVASPLQLGQVETAIGAVEGVNRYRVIRSYGLSLLSLEESDTGQVLSRQEIGQRLEAAQLFPFGGPPQDEELNRLELLDAVLGRVDARDLATEVVAEDSAAGQPFVAGRDLRPDDAGQPVMVLTENTFITAVGINVGDRLTFEVTGGGSLIGGGASETLTFEVIGMVRQSMVSGGFDSGVYAPAGAFPGGLQPNTTTVIVDIAEEQVPTLRRQIGTMPGVFVIETAVFTELISNLLNTFIAFPTMVAALGLVVGGVVIANSVALTTMERRREIAVMKAVGLQRERVLGMLLLENGLLGLIGGLVGVGIGLLGLVMMVAGMNVPGSALPLGTALALMLLCVAVALVAAMTSAWSASGEKPLNVLRYE